MARRVSRTASLVLRARPEEKAILVRVVSVLWISSGLLLEEEEEAREEEEELEEVFWDWWCSGGEDWVLVPRTMVSPLMALLECVGSSMYSKSSSSSWSRWDCCAAGRRVRFTK